MAVTAYGGNVNIYFPDLVEYSGKSEGELKNLSVNDLISLSDKMKSDKDAAASRNRAQDPEFARIVKKFFRPFEFLSKWFTEDEIISSCANLLSVNDICGEFKTKGSVCPYQDAEFLRRSMEYMPRYTRSGEELMERERCMVDVYRISAQYQGTKHGRVILDLLYGKCPDLRKYNFQAYEYSSYGLVYEIYPQGKYAGIYVPFEALLDGDVNAVIQRNREYAKSYNFGDFTTEKMDLRLNSEPAKELLRSIAEMQS